MQVCRYVSETKARAGAPDAGQVGRPTSMRLVPRTVTMRVPLNAGTTASSAKADDDQLSTGDAAARDERETRRNQEGHAEGGADARRAQAG